MPAVLTQLVYLKYRASDVIVVVAGVFEPRYRVQVDAQTTHRARLDSQTTHRARADAQTIHRTRVDV